MKSFNTIAIVAAIFCWPLVTHAAPPSNITNTVGICDPNAPTHCAAPNSAGQLPISGSVSASFSPFAPVGATTFVSPTGTTGSTAIPSGGTALLIYNPSSSATLYFTLGTSSGVTTSTTTGQPIGPGTSVPAATGSNTFIALITSTGTISNVALTAGTGAYTAGWGGGGGSGGGGGAITAAAGAIVDLSASPTAGSAGASINALAAGTAPANSLSIPAGANIIGALVANQSVNETQIGGTNIVSGGVAGSQAVGGPTATSGAFVANPLPGGGNGLSAEPTAVTTNHPAASWLDLTGKTIIKPYAPRELDWTATAALSSTTGAVTLLAAQGGVVRVYLTGIQCGRADAGTTANIITLSDTASTVIVIPNSGGGGGNNITFATPLRTAANTALTATSTNSIATQNCTGEGYTGY